MSRRKPTAEEHAAFQKLAIEELQQMGEPTKCPRCSGGPGDPSCGKVVHMIMDSVYTDIKVAKWLCEEKWT